LGIFVPVLSRTTIFPIPISRDWLSRRGASSRPVFVTLSMKYWETHPHGGLVLLGEADVSFSIPCGFPHMARSFEFGHFLENPLPFALIL